ncbi:S-formylglutathione hydrolase-like isoform X2 [Argiope bruennichi]|nr:S-formylglutathione hydrolase-like isoform X2 [Argiope bruennichi]
MTCNERTFIEKSGFQRYAAKHGIIVVGPDTSPRGCNIEGEEDSREFGSSASFYFDATEEKWKNNYKMYSYVTKELPSLINQEFPNNGKCGISGHSMGGHGALIIALRNPEKYASVSAFAPNTNPSAGIIGQMVLTGYLGCDRSSWADWDATLLAKTYRGPEMEILIDQGTDDFFLVDNLKPQNFIDACKGTRIKPTLRMQQGYEHSYMFVSTFIGDHFDYHAKYLCQ